MSNSLSATLRLLMREGVESNPALNRLIDDYTKYHVVLVIVGGLFLLIAVLLAIFFWRRFRRAPRSQARRWTFERKTYFCFGVVSVLVALFLAVVVAANVSNVVDPQRGFTGAIGLVNEPRAGSPAEELHQSFDSWLQSGSADVPVVVQAAIDERLSWQRPKAIICTILLAAFALLSTLIWRSLIRTSRVKDRRWRPGEWLMMVAGVITVGACLLLMLMVIGNTQGSIAPLALTLFYG